MKENFIGNEAHGFSGKFMWEGPEDGDLEPCPFCGGNDLEVWNTHTPAYAVRCVDCGADKPAIYKDHYGKTHKSLWIAKRYHKESFMSAIKEWNTRA